MMMAFAVPAATISISDLTDGMPIIQVSPDLGTVQITLTFERAVITGLLPTGVQLTPGTRPVILSEPTSDPFGPLQSDFLTLTIGAAAPTFSLTFASDGADNYLADLANLPPGTPTLLENGSLQDVSTALNSGSLMILAASDSGDPGSSRTRHRPFDLRGFAVGLCRPDQTQETWVFQHVAGPPALSGYLEHHWSSDSQFRHCQQKRRLTNANSNYCVGRSNTTVLEITKLM
jgi:hypothetical protein